MEYQKTKPLSIVYEENGREFTKTFETLSLLEIYLSDLYEKDDVDILSVNRDDGQQLTEDYNTIRVLNG